MSASLIMGTSSSEFDKLLALAMFVQTPEYHDRVKELRDLETSTRASLERATEQQTTNNAMLRQIRDERQKQLIEAQAYKDSSDADRANMARREREVQTKLADLAKREAELAAEKTRQDAAIEAATKAQTAHADQLATREASVKFREDRLTQEQAAFNLRRERIEKAYRGD